MLPILNIQHSVLMSLFIMKGMTRIGEAMSNLNRFFCFVFRTSVMFTDYFKVSSFCMACCRSSSLKFSTFKKLMS